MITMFFLGVICAFSFSSIIAMFCVATLFWTDDNLAEMEEITLPQKSGQVI
jgi:hypothetical protein